MDENFLLAIIIALVGGFFTVLIANRLGGQLEGIVQKMSHQWVQWPQRIFMGVGILTFVLIAINFYYVRTEGTNIFTVISEWSFFQRVPEPVRWFFSHLGAEFQVVIDIIKESPQRTPLILILTVLFFLYIFMTLLGAKWTQKLIAVAALGFILVFLFNDNFKNFKYENQRMWNSYVPETPAEDWNSTIHLTLPTTPSPCDILG